MATTYKVGGMSCGGCVRSVTAALQTALPSVKVEVRLEEQSVRIDGDHDPAAIQRTIEDAGFEFLT